MLNQITTKIATIILLAIAANYPAIARSEAPPESHTIATTEDHNGSGENATYLIPVKGTITSGFGRRWGRMHKGIDIAAPTGTPVLAAESGTVAIARWDSGGYGNLIELQHPNGSTTRYGHNSETLVSEGEYVEQGQVIALVGSTGHSTGPHCHFEIRLNNVAVNPTPLLETAAIASNSSPRTIAKEIVWQRPTEIVKSEAFTERE